MNLSREPQAPSTNSYIQHLKVMQVTSLLSRQEDHDHDESCASCGHDHGHDHSHAVLPLAQTLIGLVFVFNSFAVTWVFSDNNNPVAAASAMIGALILGYPIVLTAIHDLRRGLVTTNELVALAVLASFGSADFQVGGYQQAGVIAFFMLMGQIIETRTAEGARASIESLIKLTPPKARRVTKDGEEEVETRFLAVGDVIRVRPGDNVAADGVIVTGQGSFNQATITGESLPVDKKPGDEVFAGTQNLTGALEIRVTRAGQDTTLGKVRELILAAEKTKLPPHADHRSIHGLLHPAGPAHRRFGLGLYQRFEPRHRRLHRRLPLRLHPGHPKRDGRRPLGGGAPWHPHQKRRRHRAGGQNQRLCI